MGGIKEGDWVITKSKRIGYVGFEDIYGYLENDPHVYLYFFSEFYDCRSYKTNSLTKVEPAIAKMLTDVHKEQIKNLTKSILKGERK